MQVDICKPTNFFNDHHSALFLTTAIAGSCIILGSLTFDGLNQPNSGLGCLGKALKLPGAASLTTTGTTMLLALIVLICHHPEPKKIPQQIQKFKQDIETLKRDICQMLSPGEARPDLSQYGISNDLEKLKQDWQELFSLKAGYFAQRQRKK